MRRVLWFALVLACAAVFAAQSAMGEPGGNAANAKECQKGGWQTLFRADGSAFANAGECVAYAAQGGTLSRKSQAQLLCESFGGLYLVGSGIQLWACEYLANSVAFEALERQCFQDGGEFFTFVNGDFFGLRIDGCLDLEPES